MRFKNKVTQYFVTAFIFPFIILSILSVILFSNTFHDYLTGEQTKKFERLELLTKQMFLNASSPKDLNRYLWYIAEEKVDITFYDQEGDIQYQFSNAVDRSPFTRKSDYLEKKSAVIQDGRKIGSITIGYYDDSYLSPAALNFRNTLALSIALSAILACIIGFLMSHYFSKNISSPVLSLSKNTDLIRSGKYEDLDLPRSNFFEINQLSMDLGYLAKALDLQKKIRTSYAQDISHELRTPITNMQLHLEAMEDGIIDCDKDNIQILLGEIHRLNGLIKDLKQSFDDDASKMNYVESTFEISEMLSQIVDSIGPRFLRNDVQLQFDAPFEMEITTDEDKLRTMVYNLLTNGLKATKGSENAHVKLGITRTSNRLLIHVKDNGIGIKPEDLTKIFDRFYRVDDARNTKDNGYGLGLSIVKNIADLLGIKVLVHSKVNLGTEFILEMDLDHINGLELYKAKEEK
ncbi:MAG: HAMP domain-containing sensor histidine kinase [Tissierellia bacterium]|nr:HAMP domain-containing sensor histidine kinase [Tissierellia bacterium]